MKWGWLIVASAGVAHADRTPPTDAQRAAYRQALAAGRAAQAKKDWRTATARFTEASQALPDDATALGELGWTAYLAGDLDAAERRTKQALAANGAGDAAGAVYYNLGLIEEKRGDKAAAVKAYGASLHARPHGVVRAALAKLDPAAAAKADPMRAAAMDATPSLDAFCKSQVADAEDFACECKHERLAPGVEHVAQTCSAKMRAAGNQSDWIAFQTGGRWFTAQLFGTYNAHYCWSEGKGATATAHGARFGVELKLEGGCDNTVDSDTWKTTLFMVVGALAGAAVAAGPVAIVHHEERRGDSGNSDVDVALKVAWTGKGVALSGKTSGLNAAAATDLLGAHDLEIDP